MKDLIKQIKLEHVLVGTSLIIIACFNILAAGLIMGVLGLNMMIVKFVYS